jgi:hypothetical protein
MDSAAEDEVPVPTAPFPPAARRLPDDPSRASFLRRHATLLFLLGFYAVLAVRALPTDLSGDERVYMAEYGRAAVRLPALSVDPHLPVPPLGVAVYALLHAASGGRVLALRLLSLTCLVVAAALTAAYAQRRWPAARSGGVLFLIFSSPLVLEEDAFVVKPTAFAMLLAVGGTIAWIESRRARSLRLLAVAATLIGGAVLVSQLCAALALALPILTALRTSTPPRLRASAAEWVVSSVPAALIGLVFLLWGGFQPPAYREFWLEHEVARSILRPGQWAMGAFLLGAILAPGVGLTWRRLGLALLVAVPAALAFHTSGILETWQSSGEQQNGPFRWLLGIVPSYAAQVVIAGLVAGLGVVLLVAEAVRDGEMRHLAFYALVYAAMMNFMPYYIERYWAFLLIPGSLVALPRFLETTRPAARGLRALGIAANLKMALSSFGFFALLRGR